MKYLFSTAALLAATVVANKRDLCSDGSIDYLGNAYCQNVTGITYTGVGGEGSYDAVNYMGTDENGNAYCTSTPSGYSGSMSPLDQEVSMHFRGPLQLLQFAVYTPSTSTKKRSARQNAHARRHAHGNAHGHQHHARDAAVGDMVTATINGVVQTWINEWSGEATSAPVSSAGSATAAPEYVASSASSAASASATSSSDSDAGSISSSSGGWARQAYYNASSGTSEGLVFLNHFGGTGSGTFDTTFGNSLSFATADGNSGATNSTILEATTLPSSAEVLIMTDNPCSGDDCGYFRNGTANVAYHGFDGPSKAFFFEFQMPDTGETEASEYSPVNMPAIWMLNALIPRTLQYGQEDCSCWQSGCGEFDIFEVLDAGDNRMKSTLHGNIAGGDSDYFSRPTDKPIKAAMVLYDDNIHIQILENFGDFDTTMDTETISGICSSTSTQTDTVSLFALAG